MQDLCKQSQNARLDEVNKNKNILKFEARRKKRKEMIAYHELINRTWRSQEEVVQAPPIMYLVVPILEGPLSKILQNLRFGEVDDKDNRIIMEIVVCKCEECLEVMIQAHAPSGNRGIGDSRHREVLRSIHNEQINPCMSPGNRGIATSTVCSNLIT